MWMVDQFYCITLVHVNIGLKMKNRHLGILLVLAGVITIFVKHESAWIISAVLIGGGTGIFFWKDKVESEEDK